MLHVLRVLRVARVVGVLRVVVVERGSGGLALVVVGGVVVAAGGGARARPQAGVVLLLSHQRLLGLDDGAEQRLLDLDLRGVGQALGGLAHAVEEDVERVGRGGRRGLATPLRLRALPLAGALRRLLRGGNAFSITHAVLDGR